MLARQGRVPGCALARPPTGRRRRGRTACSAVVAAAAPGDGAPAPLRADDASASTPTPTPPTPPSPILYFAYGANMSPAVLARRGVAPSSSSPAVLVSPPSLRLAFAHRAAFATLLEVEGEEEGCDNSPAPHGVLYGLDDAAWSVLEKAEVGYGWRDVEVAPYCRDRGAPPSSTTTTTTVTARAFVSSPLHRLRGGKALPPPRPYLDRLIEGAAAGGVDEGYRAWLGQMDSIPSPAGLGLPGVYYETPGRDLIVGVGLGLAASMVGWALVGGM